jgi:hypothetical protein
MNDLENIIITNLTPSYSLSDAAREYLISFLTPLYIQISESNNLKHDLKKVLDKSLYDEIFNLKLNDKSHIMNYICGELFANIHNIKVYFQKHIESNGQYLIDNAVDSNFIYYPVEIFITFFYVDKYRKQFLGIMPNLKLTSYNPFEDGAYDIYKPTIKNSLHTLFQIPNKEDVNFDNIKYFLIGDIIAIFTSYLNNLYTTDLEQFENDISFKYELLPSMNPIVYTLVQNIRQHLWDVKDPMYYIISLYDNDLIGYGDIINL